MVLEMRGAWPYSCCFVGCCFQDLFNIARSIILQLLSSFFSMRLVSVDGCIHIVVWTWLLIEKMCFNQNQTREISTLTIWALKLEDKAASHLLKTTSIRDYQKHGQLLIGHIYIYIYKKLYIYVYICVCVWECVWVWLDTMSESAIYGNASLVGSNQFYL